MKKKFTEGKWIMDDIDILSESGMAICQVYDASDSHILDMDMDVINANAKLIAAAPGLLEACIKLKEWNDKYPPGRIYDYSQGKAIENELTSIVKMQFEAIKKATE